MHAVVLLAAAAVAQTGPDQVFNAPPDAIRVHNDANQPWSLWMYVESRKGWARPELFLPKKTTVKVNLASPGRYYLVLRDEAKRDTHYGWVDLHAISRKLPREGVVALSAVTETRTREETYTVLVPVTKTETVREVIDGKVLTRQVVRTVNVPEQRTRTMNYTVVVPTLDVVVGDQRTALSAFAAPNTIGD